MSNLPADWAIEKAIPEWDQEYRKNGVALPPRVKGDAINPQYYPYADVIMRLARYIEAHEKPPVDRKMLVAREAAARYYEAQGGGYESAVNLCREGLNDESLPVVLEAITLWEDGFGKVPETTVPQCQ